jgi:hypothetical protein
MRSDIDEKLKWITEYIGATGDKYLVYSICKFYFYTLI